MGVAVIIFIQVPKQLILVWIRLIRQVRAISFIAFSLHPIHPLGKCSPWVLTQVNTIKNSEMGQAICHPFWKMYTVGRVPLKGEVKQKKIIGSKFVSDPKRSFNRQF